MITSFDGSSQRRAGFLARWLLLEGLEMIGSRIAWMQRSLATAGCLRDVL